jgi:DNA-binding LacI/PurR family transcriptional regulator
VADHAGVSKSAAAAVLSGRAVERRLSAACIDKVHAAAKALGYRGNYHAKTLSTGRSSTIGLTVGASDTVILTHEYWAAIAGGIESAARQRGYDVLLAGGSSAEDALTHARELLDTGRIDALVIPRQLFTAIPSALLKHRRPSVVIGGENHEYSPCDVRLDPAPGITAAVSHLASLGHRSVLWIDQAHGRVASLPGRRAAFRAAMRTHRLKPSVMTIPEASSVLATLDEAVAWYRAELAKQVWPPGVTAVCCYNDQMAVALQGLLAMRGLRVPEDVSVVGFDDAFAAVASVPALTTVSHRLSVIGATAVELAFQLLDGKKAPAVRLVPAQLVVRASTARRHSDV